MKKLVLLFFAVVLLAMLGVTTWASSYENVFSATRRLLSEPWVVATLFDAYFGFLTFFLWVSFKETSTVKKLFWFVAIMAFGNIAMAIYALLEVKRLGQNFTVQRFLAEPKKS